LILARIQEADCKGGYILDGFPRTRVQAEALDKVLKAKKIPIDAVMDFDVNPGALVARLTGRRVCPNGHGEWHVKFHPPKSGMNCDVCQAPLIQREDDQEDRIRTRMEMYRKDTEPLKQYYGAVGLLKTILAEGEVADISRRIETAVKALPAANAGKLG